MYIPIILGTARVGRQSEKVAKYILELTEQDDIDSEILDARDYRIDATNKNNDFPLAQKYAEKIRKASGVIIVSPEYNHGYPGELKMMLDMAYEEYHHKPIGIVGVSNGPIGGARMAEQIRQVSIELHMIPIETALYFPLVQNLFDENDKIKDNAYEKRFEKFIDEMKFYARTVKP